MANITERNGKFHVRVYRREGSVCKSFSIKKDAIAWARQTEADIQAGRWRPPSLNNSITLRDSLTRYAKEITPTKKGAVKEVSAINMIIKEKVTLKRLSDLKSSDIAALRDKWMKTLASATVRRRLAIISHCFEIARKEWSIEITNPVSLIRKPFLCNSRDRRVQVGELEAVLTASESAELHPVALLAVETAMRLSEIVGLQWSDVSIANRTVTLHDTKNGSRRIVPLSPPAIDIFKQLPRRIDGIVFGISGPSVSQAWSRAVERARNAYQLNCPAADAILTQTYLTDLHFHDLRHEATSRLFERGFGAMEVASITGHKTLQMLSRYTHMDAMRLAEKLATSATQTILVGKLMD